MAVYYEKTTSKVLNKALKTYQGQIKFYYFYISSSRFETAKLSLCKFRHSLRDILNAKCLLLSLLWVLSSKSKIENHLLHLDFYCHDLRCSHFSFLNEMGAVSTDIKFVLFFFLTHFLKILSNVLIILRSKDSIFFLGQLDVELAVVISA